MAKVRLLYSCKVCDLQRVGCDVEERGESEDLMVWMEKATTVIARDHAYRSDGCPSSVLSELLIPIAGADKVGGVAVN